MRILFATVGGSHKPIVHAIQQLQPDHVVFVCSERTEYSKSSLEMITGKGKVIKKNPRDEKPTLPNIPAQLSLPDDTYHVLLVPPDDLDAAVQKIEEEIEAQGSDHELIADYTGGTKTMTAAMVLASLNHPVQLYLVKGARTNLEKVVDGTQWCSRAMTNKVRFHREFASNLKSWQRFAYGEAALGLADMDLPADISLQNRYMMAMTLSHGFEAWNGFNHHEARALLTAFRTQTARYYAPYFKTLDVLCANHDPARTEGARIYDLWLNALRCAAASRYDDAVSRVYRVIEWMAQWVLKTQCRVDTSDLPADFIPEHITIFTNHDGKLQAPLHKAWELLAHRATGPLHEFIKANMNDLRTPLGIRNRSILAHGFTPVSRQDWDDVENWMNEKLLPAFYQELERVRLTTLCPQLPSTYAW